MADNEFLRQTLTYYREQRQRIIEQLRPVDLIIRQIETELGETPDSGSVEIPLVFPPLAADGGGDRKPATNNKRPDLRGDEFFGMSQGEAARSYVTKVGHAVELDELLQALSKGGCHVGGADPSRTLYIALIRNTKDFVKLPNGLLGLRSMYPSLKPSAGNAGKPKAKSKGKKKAAKKRAAKASAGKGRTTASKSAVPDSPPNPEGTARQPLPVKATVLEVLSNGEFQNKDDIVQRVQEKIGMGARSFTIVGVLNKPNDFERDGERYRLKTARAFAAAGEEKS